VAKIVQKWQNLQKISISQEKTLITILKNKVKIITDYEGGVVRKQLGTILIEEHLTLSRLRHCTKNTILGTIQCCSAITTVRL